MKKSDAAGAASGVGQARMPSGRKYRPEKRLAAILSSDYKRTLYLMRPITELYRTFEN